MTIRPFAKPLLLGLSGLALFATPHAEAALGYNDGDLILGFRATSGAGSASSYLVNLGSASTFIDATDVIVLDTEIGNLLADLNATFNADWKTRAEVLWSVSGVQRAAGNGFAANTMFVTNAQTSGFTLGVQGSTAWTRPSNFGAGTPAGKVQSMGLAFQVGDGDAFPNGNTESTNSPVALTQLNSASNSFRSFMPNGVNTTGASAYGFFLSATGIEGNFGAGTSGVVLDFYNVAPGTGAAAFEGTFSISDSAAVTFTPTGVPEPSSMLALGLGATVLGMIRRRPVNR